MATDTETVSAGPRADSPDALQHLGLMARCIAHDLNNHLTAAYGQLELARIRGNPTVAQSRHLRDARRELEFCSDLVSYLVPGNLSTIVALDRNADPHEALDEAVEKYSAALDAHGVSVKLELAPEQLSVSVPAWVLKHVFTNLIGNACDAMPDGGELHVSSRDRDGRFEMTFRDTGAGIAPKDLARVFDPSFTTKAPPVGHGMGLAACNAAMARFGGGIDVESDAGDGAAFTVVMRARDG